MLLIADEVSPKRQMEKFHVEENISVPAFDGVQVNVSRTHQSMFCLVRDEESILQFRTTALGVDELSAVVALNKVKKVFRQAVKGIVLPERILLDIAFVEQELSNTFHDVLGHFPRAERRPS